MRFGEGVGVRGSRVMDELRIGMLVSLVRNEVDLQGVGDGVLKRRRRTNKRRKKESFKMFDLINSERASQ